MTGKHISSNAVCSMTKRATLKDPDKMNAILLAYIREGTAELLFTFEVVMFTFKVLPSRLSYFYL